MAWRVLVEKEEEEVDRLILAKRCRREEARSVLVLGVAPVLGVVPLLLLLVLLAGREEKEAEQVEEQGVAPAPTTRTPAVRLVRARS